MIQWYPGHMAKAIREIKEKIKLVDLVVVLLDARIPESSFNPLLKETINQKKTLYILTKKDKADPVQTNRWLQHYEKQNVAAIAIDNFASVTKKQIIKQIELLMAEKRVKDLQRGLKPRPIKTMIVGIPNVGKSTLINTITGKKVTAVGDRPGITKNQQWIRINQNVELLDTPGVLWPKFDNQQVGMHLAITGAIKDDVLPIDDVGAYLIDFMVKNYPGLLKERYQIAEEQSNIAIITDLAHLKKYYLDNKEIDTRRVIYFLLYELRNDYLGKITLDWCPNE